MGIADSAFTYKDRLVNARQIGRELGVRYLLEGSVQRSGNQVRITAQLIAAGARSPERSPQGSFDCGGRARRRQRGGVRIVGPHHENR
jgi:hypothetical protein